MKIVCRGKVYDLDWNETWRVCDLPRTLITELGHQHEVHRELRRTKVTKDSRRTGDFFVLETVDGDIYYRNKVKVTPLAPDEAAALAEDHLDYDAYVDFFGDPRGSWAENDEKVKAADKRTKDTESSRDFWVKECNRVSKERDELREKLGEVWAKPDGAEQEGC